MVSDNEGGRWCFDVAGRPAWWSRGAGTRVERSYDSSGRLVGVTRSGGGSRRYEWGESGRIERVIDADGVVEVDNAYDEAGRVVRQRSAFGRVSHYSYLPGGGQGVPGIES